MSVQGRDVVFKFTDSCNCCWWRTPLDDTDPVYVSPKGKVHKFDYHRGPGAVKNAKQSIANLQSIIAEISETPEKAKAIHLAIGNELDLNLKKDIRILRAREVRLVQKIAFAVLFDSTPVKKEEKKIALNPLVSEWVTVKKGGIHDSIAEIPKL